EIDEEHLIFSMVDNLAELGAAPGQVHRRQLALEHGILKVVAVVPHGLEHLPQPLVLADVIADQVTGAHQEDISADYPSLPCIFGRTCVRSTIGSSAPRSIRRGLGKDPTRNGSAGGVRSPEHQVEIWRSPAIPRG